MVWNTSLGAALLISGCRFVVMAWVGKWEETHILGEEKWAEFGFC
jgi:hypothetical protein